MARGDPYFMKLRYQDRCARCLTLIKRGAQAVYAPNGRRVFCTGEECGAEIMRKLSAAKHDEEGR